MFLTSMILGVKIRTMWMSPFYLFFGVLLIYIFQTQINSNKLKSFVSVFIILFILSPFAYAYVSITQTDKRTDYPGKEIAKVVQEKWNSNFISKIGRVIGDEWHAGNLSYHLDTRPKWFFGRGKPLPKNFKGVSILVHEAAELCPLPNIKLLLDANIYICMTEIE